MLKSCALRHYHRDNVHGAGPTASTSYNYRVRPTDAAENVSTFSSKAKYSPHAGADSLPPTAPANLTDLYAPQFLECKAGHSPLGFAGHFRSSRNVGNFYLFQVSISS